MKSHHIKQTHLLKGREIKNLETEEPASFLQEKSFLHVSTGVLTLAVSQVLEFIWGFYNFLLSILKLFI